MGNIVVYFGENRFILIFGIIKKAVAYFFATAFLAEKQSVLLEREKNTVKG